MPALRSLYLFKGLSAFVTPDGIKPDDIQTLKR